MENSKTPASIAILDFESTGLPFTRPRVTEVALVGLSVHRFEELAKTWAEAKDPPSPLKAAKLPADVKSLDFLVNPIKRTSAAWLNGLTDELLAKEEPFSKKTLGRILGFLADLPAPVAVVAHNGKRFDFPLLLKEIKLCSGRAEWAALSPNLLWLDSMAALRTIEKGWIAAAQKAALDAEYEAQTEVPSPRPPPPQEALTPSSRKRKLGEASFSSQLRRRVTRSLKEQLKEEPEAFEMKPLKAQPKRSGLENLAFLDTAGWSRAKRTRLELQLSFDGRRLAKMKKTGSFSEGKVFGELFPGFAEPSHRALDDCAGLLSICLAYGAEMGARLRADCEPWEGIQPMQ